MSTDFAFSAAFLLTTATRWQRAADRKRAAGDLVSAARLQQRADDDRHIAQSKADRGPSS